MMGRRNRDDLAGALRYLHRRAVRRESTGRRVMGARIFGIAVMVVGLVWLVIKIRHVMAEDTDR